MKKTTNHLILVACLSFLSLSVSAETYNISGTLNYYNDYNAGATSSFNVFLETASGDIPDVDGATVTGITGSFFGETITGLSPFNSADQLLFNTSEHFNVHGVSFTLSNPLFNSYGFDANVASLFYSAGPDVLGSWALPTGAYAAIGSYPVIDSTTGYVLSRYAVSSVAAVPEPETYAMFIAGLGLLGFVSRKKKVS